MNPGFLSFILMLISLILLASGWRPLLLTGIPGIAVVLFYAAWCLMELFRFQWRNGEAVNGIVLVLAALVLIVTLFRRSPLGMLHFVSIGLFLASVYYLLKHLGHLNPFFFPERSWSAASLTVAVSSAMLIRKPKDQIAVIAMALVLGTLLYRSVHRIGPGATFGDFRFQDEWWFAVFTARVLSMAGEFSVAAARGASKSLLDRWKGFKK